MFENEIAINEFQLQLFDKITADLSEDSFFRPAAGHGHPPVWLLGHLIITGEMGLSFFGKDLAHRKWLVMFGPGSSDQIVTSSEFQLEPMRQTTIETYRDFREMAAQATPELANRDHGVDLFAGSPIRTAGQVISLLLTNHFGFHLSQLSSCRRELGKGPLF